MAADPELTDAAAPDGPNEGAGFEFLEVDAFLRDLVSARALKTAFELQLVDLLLEGGGRERVPLAEAIGADPAGFDLLADLLIGSGVLTDDGKRIALTDRFRRALAYRDLLQTRLDFAGFVTADFMEFFSDFVANPALFQNRSRLFRLFDYDKALVSTPENYRHTKIWIDFTTILSRYEAQACLANRDFSSHRRMLDVGGNSGEFALQICRANPELRATVLDLPVVCEIGREHVLMSDERDRIGFVAGNALDDDWPTGFDLVSWKSMLHDWPEDHARQLLAKARGSLEPEGQVLIFERGPIPVREEPPPFSILPTLLFARSYRPAAWYVTELEALGYREIEVREFDLETPFFLVTAKVPA